jgi:hypothetical protein
LSIDPIRLRTRTRPFLRNLHKIIYINILCGAHKNCFIPHFPYFPASQFNHWAHTSNNRSHGYHSIFTANKTWSLAAWSLLRPPPRFIMNSDLEKNAAPVNNSMDLEKSASSKPRAVSQDLESQAPTLISHTPDPQLHHEAVASRASLPVGRNPLSFICGYSAFSLARTPRSRRQNRGYRDRKGRL